MAIDKQNYQEFVLRSMDDELSASEQVELEEFLKSHPQENAVYKSFLLVKLPNSERPVFPRKELLKQKEVTIFTLNRTQRRIISIAAMFIFFVSIYFLNSRSNVDTKPTATKNISNKEQIPANARTFNTVIVQNNPHHAVTFFKPIRSMPMIKEINKSSDSSTTNLKAVISLKEDNSFNTLPDYSQKKTETETIVADTKVQYNDHIIKLGERRDNPTSSFVSFDENPSSSLIKSMAQMVGNNFNIRKEMVNNQKFYQITIQTKRIFLTGKIKGF